ncbi:MAG TPA: GNAT family protein [Solirubrobacteraceae bacterium]|nr:GNAT family protein [Solirubrobacteraceae bacterium]
MRPFAHRLAVALDSAGRGEFPKADGAVEVLSPPPGPAMGIVAFTAHHMIATSAPESWIRAQLPPGDLRAPMSPRFLTALGDKLGGHDDGIDLLLAARGLQGRSTLRETTSESHPRLTRANIHRDQVRVFTDPTGAATIILGRGLANRTEVSIEIDPTRRNQGIARQALTEARRIVDADQLLFAQAAPGNAASIRTLLTAGFQPIGSEVLFYRPSSPRSSPAASGT